MATKKPAAKKAAPRSTKKFMRNLRGVEVGIRLERQERPKKRHDLKPRGMRGDLVLLHKEDLSDPVLTENVALGLVEIITEAEAKAVIEQQSTNQQAREHPAMESLRNELGEKMEGGVTVEADEADRGQVVARLNDGQLPTQGPGGVNWERARMTNPEPGHEQPMRNTTVDPRNVQADGVTQVPVDPAEAADAAARSKSNQSAQELGLKVSVEPTKKS